MSLAVERDASRTGALAVLLTGAGVAVVLGAYAGLHEPAGRPLVTFGFSGMLQMKAWLTTAAADSPRVLVHSTVGCLFYGAYAAKMLGLRLPGLPRWAVPVLGGLVLALLTLIWLTSALWFFSRSGLPLT